MSAGEQRQTQRFRRATGSAVLTTEQKDRQAKVTGAAWTRFGARDPMMAFLNTDDPRLGGRPLDLAVNGEEGLRAVLAALKDAPAT